MSDNDEALWVESTRGPDDEHPGCTKSEAARGGGRPLYSDAVERAIRRGLIRQEQDRPASRYRLYAAPVFTCPCCGAASCHPKDVEFRYCGRCRWWTGDPNLGPPHLAEPCPERKASSETKEEER
jgi:hypothetical protein